jgi:hypothetical protein
MRTQSQAVRKTARPQRTVAPWHILGWVHVRFPNGKSQVCLKRLAKCEIDAATAGRLMIPVFERVDAVKSQA